MPLRHRILQSCLAISAALALGGGAGPGRAAPEAGQAPGDAASSPAQLALVEHLHRSGVVLYGAWWCPATTKQKALFGQPAEAQLPYVECDKDPAGRQRCTAAGIEAYPTWVKGSERLVGVESLEQLRRWSGLAE